MSTTTIPDSDKLLTEKQVADMLGVSARTIRRMVSSGDFPRGIPIGADGHRCRRRWLRQDVTAYIDRKATER